MSKFPLLFSCIAVVFSSCGSTVATKEESIPKEFVDAYSLTIADENNINYSGYLNYDNYSNQAGVNGAMYSGYNAGSFLATVLAHAMVSKSVDAKKKRKFKAESDEFLSVYESSINTVTSGFLTANFIESLEGENSSVPVSVVPSMEAHQIGKGHILSQPSFVVTQDVTTIIISNRVALFNHGELGVLKAAGERKKRKGSSSSRTPKPVYSNTMVIINNLATEGDVVGDNAVRVGNDNLGALSSELFDQSLRLMLTNMDAQDDVDGKAETIKFHIGSNFRVERGVVLEKTCDRVVFKTLRGWIKSVPQESQCSEQAQL
ncbi:MAG: hypothetical protein COA42_15960 [Alteromonadaceae bacterium]|nr:MAG: hypothetical protein COA42_15960 [Alteromonadaceae bacterium]